MMQLDSLYQEVILDHYKNPSHKHLLSDCDVKVHHVNPSCGDEQDLTLKTDGLTIQKIGWDGVGCSISQASTSIMTELLTGKTLEDALEIHKSYVEMIQSKGKISGDENLLEDAVAFSGVSKFPARIKCALLGWMAFKDALSQSLEKTGKQI
jgi:nitrogen fixation protein NifU and related proteins